MFTGIIEKVGTIKSIADNKNASREFIVSVDDMFEDIKEGDSINNMLKTIQNHNFLISFIPVTNEVMRLVGLVTFFNLIKSES